MHVYLGTAQGPPDEVLKNAVIVSILNDIHNHEIVQ